MTAKSQDQFQAIELLIPDLNGILRGKRVNRDEFDAVFESGVNLPATACIVDSRGQTIPTLRFGSTDGDPDYCCKPDLSTLTAVPWSETRLGQCLTSLYHDDGTAHFADSRQLLSRVVTRLAADGLHPSVAVELEFYLLVDDTMVPPVARAGTLAGMDGAPSGPQVYSVEDLRELEGLFAAINDACEKQGLPASTAISEYAPGQFEINLHHVPDPLLAADHAVLMRRLIRGVAGQFGLAATFMAKPFTRHAGSSMHVHVSLADESGANVLADDSGRKLAHAAGGLIEMAAESMAIFYPNPNSYRRLQTGSFSPRRADWGINHRGVAFRVPKCDRENTRIENRLGGADANPYLVVAATLAAMHHGLQHGIEAPPATAEGETIEREIGLPASCETALDAFAEGRVLPDYFGRPFCETYAAVKRYEAGAHHSQVSDIDYAWYLRSI